MIYRVQVRAGSDWREMLNTNAICSAKVKATMLYLEGYTSRVIDAEGVTLIECGARAVTPVTAPAEQPTDDDAQHKRTGIARHIVRCHVCDRRYTACRTDSTYCSARCRKRQSRAMIAQREQA